jgi:fructose-1,6-bisphosphatase II / sedoheptulose-1,7-bisphosphatase
MDKIAIGPGYDEGVIDLDADAGENITELAKAKGVPVSAMTACVLDRPRHAEIIESLRSVGARIAIISDGDVAGVINTTNPSTGVDMYVGSGGAPEGVLAAAALKCVGGQMQGRLVFRNDDERKRADRTGITDYDKKYDLNGLASGETVFCATGVTKGGLVDGVTRRGGIITTDTLVMSSADGMVRKIKSYHRA